MVMPEGNYVATSYAAWSGHYVAKYGCESVRYAAVSSFSFCSLSKGSSERDAGWSNLELELRWANIIS